MTPEDQRIAIAEACGWDWDANSVWSPTGSRSDRSFSPLADENDATCLLPDYLNDLNAISEAVKKLPECGGNDKPAYARFLADVTGARWGADNSIDNLTLCEATAAQRAEAFLRTIGKWKD